jgi:Fe-S cluster biosynthesis and repair protein YggX
MAALTGATLALGRAQTNETSAKSDKPALTEEPRAQVEQRLNDAWSKLPLETKMRIMRLHRALGLMPPEERKFLHDRMERFLNMSPEERERLRKNVERWQKMTPEERQQAREEFRQRRRDFEEKWRQEHPGEEPPPFPYRPRHAPPPPPPAPEPADQPEQQ